jgi:60S ribosomal protein uL30
MSDDPHRAVLRPKNPGESLKVAESVLRKRDRNLKVARKRIEKVQKIKSQKKTQSQAKFNVQSAAKMLQSRKLLKQEKNRLKTVAKRAAPKVNKGRSVLLVVRNGREGGSPDVKAKLRELGLRSRNCGVFLKNDEQTLKDLRVVQPFCFWGPPTLQSVTDLLYKKAFLRAEDKEDGPVPLQDNRVIEERLGQFGMLCVEDLVEGVYQGQDALASVQGLLLPMKFADIRTTHGLTKQVQHTYGDLKKDIDKQLDKLLG